MNRTGVGATANHKKVLYFLHIPKTAGMSLTALLETWVTRFFCADEAVCRSIDLYELVRNHWDKIQEYRFFRGHMGYQLVSLLDVPVEVIVVLRHPFDQLHSLYKHIMREGPAHFMYENARKHDFEGFIWDERCRPFLSNYQSQFLVYDFDVEVFRRCESLTALDKWGRKYLERLARRPPEDLYRTARTRLDACHWVGATEELDRFAQVLSRAFGWPLPEGSLERSNVSADQTPAIGALSSASLKRLVQLLPVDLRLYAVARQRMRAHCAQFGISTAYRPIAAPGRRRAARMESTGKPSDDARADAGSPPADMTQRLAEPQTNGTVWREDGPRLEVDIAKADADRRRRECQIEELTRSLRDANVDRLARFDQIQILKRLLQEANVDRQARLDQIVQLTSQLREAEADRLARLVQIEELTRLLKEANADREARPANSTTAASPFREDGSNRGP